MWISGVSVALWGVFGLRTQKLVHEIMMHSNGENRFWLSVTSEMGVGDIDWAIALMAVDAALKANPSVVIKGMHVNLEESENE